MDYVDPLVLGDPLSPLGRGAKKVVQLLQSSSVSANNKEPGSWRVVEAIFVHHFEYCFSMGVQWVNDFNSSLFMIPVV